MLGGREPGEFFGGWCAGNGFEAVMGFGVGAEVVEDAAFADFRDVSGDGDGAWGDLDSDGRVEVEVDTGDDDGRHDSLYSLRSCIVTQA